MNNKTDFYSFLQTLFLFLLFQIPFKIFIHKNLAQYLFLILFNYWLVVISFTIPVLLILISLVVAFFQQIKRNYFVDDQKSQGDATPKKYIFDKAKEFFRLYYLINGQYQKYLTSYSVRIFSFYTELINLMVILCCGLSTSNQSQQVCSNISQ